MSHPLPELDADTLRERHSLLCRALQATPDLDDPQPASDIVKTLDDLIHRSLLELARLGSPDDFADIYQGFTRELARFREFCAFPHLANKNIIAFGGPFSAGKSSLINTLLGHKLLVVEVDPTTALPTYLLKAEEDAIHALNLHQLRVRLSDAEFATLTHDELPRYGSQASRAFSAAFITRQQFPWSRLALIDTPGYTGRTQGSDRTDADLAAAQLGSAHAIVWVVSVKQGELTEADLAFLATLDPAIPRIVVVTRADEVTDTDRDAVLTRIRHTLATRNLPVLGVYPASNRPRLAALLDPLRTQLNGWSAMPRPLRFAHRFKALFTRYQRGLEREAKATRWQLQRVNRIATLTDGEAADDADALQARLTEHLNALADVQVRLRELCLRFFAELKRAGDTVGMGMALTEPSEIDLLEPGRSNLLKQLVALRQQQGHDAPEPNPKSLQGLRREGKAAHALQWVRRQPRQNDTTLLPLQEQKGPGSRMAWLTRRGHQHNGTTFYPLQEQKGPGSHVAWLTRRGHHTSSTALHRLQTQSS